MEYFRSNKNNSKIYEKINYIKMLIVIVVSFLLFTLFLYYIGKQQNLDRAVITSLIIALLLGIGSIIGDILENRSRVFVIKKDELGYLEIHTEKVGGAFLRDKEYDEALDKFGIEEIYNNSYKYEGIDKGIINDIISIKKKYNRIVVRANVVEKQWRTSSFFTISKLYVVEKEKKKKLIIPNDYDNYNKLFKKMKTKEKI